MSLCDSAIINGRIILPGVGIVTGNIGFREGIVTHLGDDQPPAHDTIDAHGRYVMPGAVDPHVHLFREQDFRPESRSAAAGGVTTMLIYLLNGESYRPIHDVYVAAGQQSFADFAFHYAIVNSSQVDEMPAYCEEHGVRSFKFFMTARGSEAERLGLSPVDDGLLLDFMRRCAELGAVACVHCENLEMAKSLERRLRNDGRDDLAAWAECRPGYVEADGVLKALNAADAAGLDTLYIVHLSSRQGIHAVGALNGHMATLETCIQYLTIDCRNGSGPLAKINPPVKYAEDIEALWAAVKQGVVKTVGTDHSPRGVDSKRGDIWEASPGFPGLATLVPLWLTEGTRRGIRIEQLCELVCSNPARQFGLYPQKGTLLPGSDADAVILDDEERTVQAATLESASGFTPYEGRPARFWPIVTLLRGKRVFSDGQIVESAEGAGRYLARWTDK